MRDDPRSDGIDVLRCVFAVYVLVFSHLVFWAPIVQGPDTVPSWLASIANFSIWLFQHQGELNPAVLGFIVLSGYCILRAGSLHPAAVPKFLQRRAFRILPIFIVANIVGVIALILAKSTFPDYVGLFGMPLLSPWCVAAKLSTVAALLPIAHPCSYIGNAPLLTVMVEIDLYLFCALSVFISRKALIAWCIAAVAIGVAVAISPSEWLYNWWQNSSFWAFLPIWWIGAAATSKSGSNWIKRATLPIAIAWLCMTTLENFVDPTHLTAELRKYATALLFARLILSSETWSLRFRPAVLVGRAGYSIYALHAPLAILMLCAGFKWWQTAASLVVIGIASFFAVERPGIEFGKSIRSSRSRRQLAPDFPSN
jgi:peptidoglycan/LPS O-acetylase OafA/YrhL